MAGNAKLTMNAKVRVASLDFVVGQRWVNPAEVTKTAMLSLPARHQALGPSQQLVKDWGFMETLAAQTMTVIQKHTAGTNILQMWPQD